MGSEQARVERRSSGGFLISYSPSTSLAHVSSFLPKKSHHPKLSGELYFLSYLEGREIETYLDVWLPIPGTGKELQC
jgi:hypothetical protein